MWPCSLIAVPVLLAVLWLRLGHAPDLPGRDGLTLRITHHAGAGILTGISTHFLVAAHTFLEMLHYGVWILALTLIGSARFWEVRTVPIARHPRGFPRIVGGVLIVAVIAVGMLWFGFSIDYATTRDVYFTVAIAHVLAEAPFLLRML